MISQGVIINNSCYKNNLDTSRGNVGSFTTQNSNNGYFINNITVAVGPPSLSIGAYSASLAPSLPGNALTLTALLSPALGKGIDPSTLPGLPSSIVSDLKNYIYVDINGKARPQGGGSDLAAYQH